MSYEDNFSIDNIWQTEDDQNKISAARTKVLVHRLVDLEMDIAHDHFAEKKVIEKELRNLGSSRSDVSDRVFDEVCNRLGVSLSTVGGNKVRKVTANKMRSRSYAKREDLTLLPGFINNKRDAVFYGESGTGKTCLTMQMVKAMFDGRPYGDQTQPGNLNGKKVLWIGPDGSVASLDQTQELLENMGVIDDEAFIDSFTFWLEDPDEGTASWNLDISNLIKLQQEVASGEYALVVIDSLKAACTKTRWSIDDRSIGNIMRLVQALVCKHAGLIWIHHSNKSRNSSSTKAAGVTDIIELVSAAIEFRQEWADDHSSKRDYIVVQKLRGGSKRTFEYDWQWDDITVVENADEDDEDVSALFAKKSELPQAILIAIRDSEYGRKKSHTLADELNQKQNTIVKNLTTLKEEEMIREKSGAWVLTSKGKAAAMKLGNRAYLEFTKPPGDAYTDF